VTEQPPDSSESPESSESPDSPEGSDSSDSSKPTDGPAEDRDAAGGEAGGGGEDATTDEAESWRAALAEAGELTPAVVEAILAAHGDRGSRAIEAVGEGRVKGYEDFTVVVGHSDEYVVEDGACTCKDATYNLDPEDPTALCWHALAADIARAVGAIEDQDMYYSEVRDFI